MYLYYASKINVFMYQLHTVYVYTFQTCIMARLNNVIQVYSIHTQYKNDSPTHPRFCSVVSAPALPCMSIYILSDQ